MALHTLRGSGVRTVPQSRGGFSLDQRLVHEAAANPVAMRRLAEGERFNPSFSIDDIDSALPDSMHSKMGQARGYLRTLAETGTLTPLKWGVLDVIAQQTPGLAEKLNLAMPGRKPEELTWEQRAEEKRRVAQSRIDAAVARRGHRKYGRFAGESLADIVGMSADELPERLAIPREFGIGINDRGFYTSISDIGPKVSGFDTPFMAQTEGLTLRALRDRRDPAVKQERERYKTDWRSMNDAIARDLIDMAPRDLEAHIAVMPKSDPNSQPEDLIDLARRVESLTGGRLSYWPEGLKRRMLAPSRNTIEFTKNGEKREYLAAMSGTHQGDVARLLRHYTGVSNRHPFEDYITVDNYGITSGGASWNEYNLRSDLSKVEGLDNRPVILLDDNVDSGNSYKGVLHNEAPYDDPASAAEVVPLAIYGSTPYGGYMNDGRDITWYNFYSSENDMPEDAPSEGTKNFMNHLLEIARVAPFMEGTRDDLFYAKRSERGPGYAQALMDDTLERFEKAKRIAQSYNYGDVGTRSLTFKDSEVLSAAARLRQALAPRLIPYASELDKFGFEV